MLYGYYAGHAKLNENQADHSRDVEHRNIMVGHIDAHIEWLTRLEAALEARDERRMFYKRCTGIIPRQEASERLIRYETHLDRLTERIVKRLERLQRMRKGQPPTKEDVKTS